ncbi:MAG TPA: hypothetical protein VHY19_05635 [Steroidobacteraceae bacterium]|jgi:hypothetical protein|nr:hypothetical protein [Steroidobacteraceae bacterium]
MQAAPVEPGVLGARLRQQQLIEDPQQGERAPLELEAGSVLWPHAAQWALIELTQVIESGARRLEEYRFVPARGMTDVPAFEGPGLPVALLFERTPNGASRARIYATPGLREPHHRSLTIDPHAAPGRDAADVLTRLARAVRDRDLAASVALCEHEARLQLGDGAVRCGIAAIRATLEAPLRAGALNANYCTRLDEGARSALELQLADRPALLVCERGASGLLSAVRIYG